MPLTAMHILMRNFYPLRLSQTEDLQVGYSFSLRSRNHCEELTNLENCLQNTVSSFLEYSIHPIYFQDITDGKYIVKEGI